METENLRTAKYRHRTDFPHPVYPGTLVLLLLVLLTTAVFQSPGQIASLQTSTSPHFTDSLQFQEISAGIEHGQVSSGKASTDAATGPWLINVLRVDLNHARLKIVRALDQGLGLETVSSLSARHKALAAINGGYFRTTGTYRGESIGVVMLNGKLISEPYNNRAAVGILTRGNSSQVGFGHINFSGEVLVGTKRQSIQGFNRPLSANEMIVFTPEFHRTTLTNPDVIEVVVRRNRVAAIADLKGSAQIPADGFVLAAAGTARDWIKRNVRRGSRITYSWELNAAARHFRKPWSRAHSFLGGGPQLIKQGKIEVTYLQEKMTTPGFATDRHPRTAIGKLGSGKLVLVTVDGRQPGVSVGMSLQTLAQLLLELGAVEAINLDGGGSTTMVVHNQIVNRPSDQSGERPVSDAILVFSKPN